MEVEHIMSRIEELLQSELPTATINHQPHAHFWASCHIQGGQRGSGKNCVSQTDAFVGNLMANQASCSGRT